MNKPVRSGQSECLSARERYDYDAYGNCHILEPNFADDPDGQSDYGNPYLFTGRRLDILDNGSLKLQYNRNRYYDQYTGRWLTQDPLGITPNPQRPNRFDTLEQYRDSLSLYEVALSNPQRNVDPYGLLQWSPYPGTGAIIGDDHPAPRVCPVIAFVELT